MSSDSSDSDDSVGGMIDSPVPSDVDSDDEKRKKTVSSEQGSVFQFASKRFSKTDEVPSTTAAARPAKRIKRNNDIDSKMSLIMNNKEKARSKRSKRDIDSDSDSDSDSENEKLSCPNHNNINKTNVGVSEKSNDNITKELRAEPKKFDILSSDESISPKTNSIAAAATTMIPPRQNRRQTRSQQNTTIELSSDDDSDNDNKTLTGKCLPENLPAEARAALCRSQEAKHILAQAQSYKAQDIHVEVQDTVDTTRLTTCGDDASHRLGTVNSKLKSTPIVSSISKLSRRGKTLRVSCKIKTTIVAPPTLQGSRRSKTQKATITKPVMSNKELMIRENDCFELLVNKIRDTLELSSDTKIDLNFDGHAIDLKKTPNFYEMEDEDLIEVAVEKRQVLTMEKGGTNGNKLRTSRQKVTARSSASNPIEI